MIKCKLSEVFESKTTGTPISLLIYNEDMQSKDYKNIKFKDLDMLILHILKNMELEITEVVDLQQEETASDI